MQDGVRARLCVRVKSISTPNKLQTKCAWAQQPSRRSRKQIPPSKSDQIGWLLSKRPDRCLHCSVDCSICTARLTSNCRATRNLPLRVKFCRRQLATCGLEGTQRRKLCHGTNRQRRKRAACVCHWQTSSPCGVSSGCMTDLVTIACL